MTAARSSKDTPARLVTARGHEAFRVRCSVIDMGLRDAVMSVLFFFERAIDADPLIDGLGRALDAYPLFAGRLREIEGQLWIDCDNQGARVSVARDDRTLRQILDAMGTLTYPSLVDPIDGRGAAFEQNPVLSARITYCRGEGMVLGLCWRHAIGDMASFMLMMKAWSDAVAGQPVSPAIIARDRPQDLAARIGKMGRAGPGVRYLGAWDVARYMLYFLREAKRKRTLWFFFGEDEVRRMKEALSASTQMRLSTNDVLCAHMMSLVTKYDDSRAPRHVSIAVNYRSRLGIPEEVMGNLIATMSLPYSPAQSAAALAGRIRRGLDNFSDEHMNYLQLVRFVEARGGSSKVRRCVALGVDPINRSISTTNWSRFGVYGVTFGGRPPLYFAPISAAPCPWLSAIVEGFTNQGFLYKFHLPTKLAAEVSTPGALKEIHRYREPGDALPELAEQLSWVL